MNEESYINVPANFPRPSHRGAVAGAHDKLLMKTYNGQLYPAGETPPEVFERWDAWSTSPRSSPSSLLSRKRESGPICWRPRFWPSIYRPTRARIWTLTCRHEEPKLKTLQKEARMKPQDDAPVPTRSHETHEPPRTALERRLLSVSQRNPTPPQTPEDTLKLIRQGRVAEMTPRQVGYED